MCLRLAVHVYGESEIVYRNRLKISTRALPTAEREHHWYDGRPNARHTNISMHEPHGCWMEHTARNAYTSAAHTPLAATCLSRHYPTPYAETRAQ